MLTRVTFTRPDPILEMIAKINNRSANATEIIPGIYEIGHWNPEMIVQEKIIDADIVSDLDTADEWGDRFESYGVCDNYKQILRKFSQLKDPNKQFVIFLVRIVKKDQDSTGGWRWHKWGSYIGDKTPQCEYIFNEGPDIEEVFTFHIYEVK